jgi:hypothetical protein
MEVVIGLLALLFNRPADRPMQQLRFVQIFLNECARTVCFLLVYQSCVQDQQTIQKLHDRATWYRHQAKAKNLRQYDP